MAALLVTLFLWMVWCALIVLFLAGVAVAAFIAIDHYRWRRRQQRSTFARWDQEMHDFERARRVTSPKGNR